MLWNGCVRRIQVNTFRCSEISYAYGSLLKQIIPGAVIPSRLGNCAASLLMPRMGSVGNQWFYNPIWKGKFGPRKKRPKLLEGHSALGTQAIFYLNKTRKREHSHSQPFSAEGYRRKRGLCAESLPHVDSDVGAGRRPTQKMTKLAFKMLQIICTQLKGLTPASLSVTSECLCT